MKAVGNKFLFRNNRRWILDSCSVLVANPIRMVGTSTDDDDWISPNLFTYDPPPWDLFTPDGRFVQPFAFPLTLLP